MRWLRAATRRFFCAARQSFSFELETQIKGVPAHPGGNYLIAYTCGPCGQRQTRSFSKQAYHKGVVVVRCEGCEKLHLIADNLGWFEEEKVNVETLAERAGERALRFLASPALAEQLQSRMPQRPSLAESKGETS